MSTLSQFFGGSTSGQPGFITAEILLLGGGGAGGGVNVAGSAGGGGGGAGQLVYMPSAILQAGVSYTITIGGGGSGSSAATGSVGNPSLFAGLYADGGGGGGRNGQASTYGFSPFQIGPTGGDGSALSSAAKSITGKFLAHGSQLNSLIIASAYAGGITSTTTTDGSYGGGTYSPTGAGPNRTGTSLSLTGSSVTYGTGGAGGTNSSDSGGTNAGANTGNGGDGANSAVGGVARAGGNGGSGVLVIAYPDTFAAPAAITGTYTTPTRTGYRVYRFTGSGSITF